MKTPAFSHLFEVDFSETYLTTSAENRVSEPPNLNVFWGEDTPDPSTKARAPPFTKDLATALFLSPEINSSSYSLTEILAECNNHFLINHLTSGPLIRDHISGIPL